MKKKEEIRNRYSVNEGNPTRKERIDALFGNKTLQVTGSQTLYHRLDKYQRLTFSYTGHPSSFMPYENGFDYSKVLDDYEVTSGSTRRVKIVDNTTSKEGETKDENI